MNDAKHPATCSMIVDLLDQTVTRSNSSTIQFTIDASLKYRLLNGLDDIELTLLQSDHIKVFEEKQKLSHPWLYYGESN